MDGGTAAPHETFYLASKCGAVHLKRGLIPLPPLLLPKVNKNIYRKKEITSMSNFNESVCSCFFSPTNSNTDLKM